MDSATQALVIINSIVLILFLVLAIIATVKLIKLINELKLIASRAEKVAENVEEAANAFKKTAGPLAVLKFISSVVSQAQKSRKKE